MIAQDLLSHLPKEFKNIVRETKPKRDEGEAYLSINYMKLSVVLWGALQEALNTVEHLEASVYELQTGVKKPKAPAKTKAKKLIDINNIVCQNYIVSITHFWEWKSAYRECSRCH